jgi:DNA-binding LacI/PurR family transcriptional regulator
MRLFQQRRIAGLILTGLSPGASERIRELEGLGIPCIVTWEKLENERIHYTGFDNFKAAFTVVNYLVGLRHRKIGLIIGPQKVTRAKQRFEGYRSALEVHGVPYDPNLVVEGDYTLVDGKEAMQRLLSRPDLPTAVFAASDVLAMGALAAIKEAGLNVPEDISVAGYDDIDFASYLDPPLTTVRVPAYEMGQLAAKTLFDLIDNDSAKVRQYCLNTDLIIRQSCVEFSNDRQKNKVTY